MTRAIPRASRNLQLLAAGLALLFAAALLVGFEYLDSRDHVVSALDAEARVATPRAIAALEFDDELSARRLLDEISAKPMIGRAAFVRTDPSGQRYLFAGRPGIDRLEAFERIDGGLFAPGISVTLPGEGAALGELRLIADSEVLLVRMARYASLVVLVVAIAFGAAYGLTVGLRRHILRAEQLLTARAHFDDLTGLPNRSLFNDCIDAAIQDAGRSGQSFAVLFCDLDHFKDVNDSLGHEVGDRLLHVVGARLRASVRDRDTVSRMGGDEFVALIEHCDAEGATRAASHIIRRLSEPYGLGDRTLSIGVSVGIALYPRDGTDAGTLLRAADTAVYAAKAAGRGAWRFFSPELEVQARERLSIENGLRRALATGELRLHYQPQVEAATRRVSGAEALLRWKSPDLGEVPPGRFIPVAEQSELMTEIGAWVLDAACRDAAVWMRQVPDFSLSVNLSARQLQDADFTAVVAACLERYGIPPARLELEIREGALLAHSPEVADNLRGLAALGVQLALDDFGTGWSSLGHLRELPLTRLKIDGGFVRDQAASERDAAIVQAIISLAAAFGLKVVAEGVETEEQFDRIAAAGCSEAQGWLFGHSMPADEFAARHLKLH